MAAADRISELPEPILHHILSSLSQRQAIQTSALSRTWRHVGPTRPKIEMCEPYFHNSGRVTFLSVLRKTLQRYHHRNLTVHEFILQMSSNYHPAINSVFSNDPGKTLFKGLKRLSLINVHIKDETTLEKIIRSCPSIEYLLVSDFVRLMTIRLTVFHQAEFLDELRIIGSYLSSNRHLIIGSYLSSNRHLIRERNVIVTADQLLLIKRLKTLSLDNINITEETLQKIMCGCPLIESLFLTNCMGLTNIQLIKYNNNLKHFTGYFYTVNTKTFEIDAPTIETISIGHCLNWYGHDKYFFPRLKTLHLNKVKMSAELFESFSSNFPSLEELHLQHCYGLSEIQEIKLTVCSIKRLIIITNSENPIKATIYAPNIHYFKFCGCPPKLIFYSETTREWKSHVDIWYCNKAYNLAWFIQLSELLNSLRESQISLKYCDNPFKNLKVEGTNDTIFCKPVPLECVTIEGGYESCSFLDIVNCLFLICRPRYIGMYMYTTNPVTDLKKEKDKLAEFMTFKTIRNEGEMGRGYLWESDLEEISIQFRDQNSQVWHTVGVEETSFPRFTSSYPRIRFSVKWRD